MSAIQANISVGVWICPSIGKPTGIVTDNGNMLVPAGVVTDRASEAEVLRWECLGSTPGGERNMDCILEEIQPRGSICKYIGWLVCSMGPTTNMAPINAGQDNLGPRVNYLGKI
jgi:hypothetical protein